MLKLRHSFKKYTNGEFFRNTFIQFQIIHSKMPFKIYQPKEHVFAFPCSFCCHGNIFFKKLESESNAKTFGAHDKKFRTNY